MGTPVNISKIKVRRGLDSERLQVVLDSGELGFTTDTQRLFIGDGVTQGGIAVSTRYVGKFASVNDIESIGLGDSVIINNIAYIYTGGNINNIGSYFASVTANVDNDTIGYNIFSQLYVKSIESLLPSSIDTNRGIEVTTGGKLGVKTDDVSLGVNASGELEVINITANQHGDLLGGNLHALVTTLSAGFMSAADKTKLDNSPNWSLNPLANDVVQKIISSINSYTADSVSNVSGANTVDVQVGNNETAQVNGNYFLNQQNSYNNDVPFGSIIQSSIASARISNVGQLPLWQFNTSSFDLANKAVILIGGDGNQYGFYFDGSGLTQTDNVIWIPINTNTSNSLLQTISSVESNDVYSYRLFDVYVDTATNFYVKGLYPNFSNFYNNVGGATGIAITQLATGKQSAALSRKLICNTSVSTSFPIVGLPTKNTVVLNSTITGATLNVGTINQNRYLTVYNSDYVKHVFYFYDSTVPTPVPSVNQNNYLPGTITVLHQIPYTSASTNADLYTALTTSIDNAGFDVLTSPAFTVNFNTSTSGYSLDIYTNYSSSVISSVTLGGDYLLTQVSGNGVPDVSSLNSVCSNIISSTGSPGVLNVKLPGVPSISYTTDSGTRNSVSLIKY